LFLKNILVFKYKFTFSYSILAFFSTVASLKSISLSILAIVLNRRIIE